MQLPELINQTIAEIQTIYLRDTIPWIIGCSWGKDSSCALQLVWQAIARLEPEQRHKQVEVITTNTGVENPLIEYYCQQSISQLNSAAPKREMPFQAHWLRPTVENSFWVLTIGKGYSKPTHRHRWCTPRLKIEPSDRFIRERVSRYGESILILGVRKDESIKRKTSIERHEQNALEPKLSPSASLINSTIYTPIVDWTTSELWQYLLQVDNPWGGDNQELFYLYRGATDASECPLVVEENTTSCGKSRFGCYICTVAQSEHSLTNTIANSESMEWLEPLLDLREKLARSSSRDRGLRQLKRGVSFHVNNVNSQLNLEPTPGKYSQEFRADLLRQLLQAQVDINAHAPERYRGITLISRLELSEIRYLWLEHHHEIEDLLPQIYREVTKQEYQEIFPERLSQQIDPDHWQALMEITQDVRQARSIAGLLSITERHSGLTKNKRYQALDNRLRQDNYTKAEQIYLGYRHQASSWQKEHPILLNYLKLACRTLPTDKIIQFQSCLSPKL